jgi:hypothetical protein
MKTDYRFWEQNVNPITMQPNERIQEFKESNDTRDKRLERERISLERNIMLDNYGEQKKADKFW